MSDYISREAAIEKAEYDGNYRLVIPVEAIKGLPAADVVPVIHCKDCVYARPLKDVKYDYLCRYWNGHSCNKNQFCSQGKRKEKTK